MNVLIVGLGSMGKRRLRLLQKEYPDYQICGVEFSEERRKAVDAEYSIRCFASTEEALSSATFNLGFVCTPPATHHEVIKTLLEHQINVFTEINLLNKGYDELLEIAKEKRVKIFMSSTLLYRKEVQTITELVKQQKQPLQYTYHVGQYLPDWHPWESYKNFFVGNNETNGCREIFAIQLPWIFQCFGKSVSVPYVSRQKISDLEITYPDSYLVALEHESGNRGIFVVDVVSRKATTSLEIVGENIHIIWDGKPEGLKVYNFESKDFESISLYDSYEQNTNYAANIIEDAYLAEITCFINWIEGKQTPHYYLEDDAHTLEIIDKIEGKNA